MTIIIRAFQPSGNGDEKIVERFKFCCWHDLKKFLDKYAELQACEQCRGIKQ